MHEWALTDAVIATALAESRKEGLEEIIELQLKIGELQQMDLAIFTFALDELAKEHAEGPLLTKGKVAMETEPAIFRGRVCETVWVLTKRD